MRANPQTEQWYTCPSLKRTFVACCLLLVGVVMPVGCNQSPSEEELGEIHYSLPQIPGAETPLKLPPPLTRKPKPKADAEAATEEKEAPSETPAADPPAENPEQQPTSPESSAAEESPASESD